MTSASADEICILVLAFLCKTSIWVNIENACAQNDKKQAQVGMDAVLRICEYVSIIQRRVGGIV